MRKKLPSRRPCTIIRLMRNANKFYVIIDRDPNTGEARGLHCHGSKPGCEVWALLHEALPIISRNIQSMKDPEHIASFFKYQRISILSDIVQVFVNEYKDWRKTQ